MNALFNSALRQSNAIRKDLDAFAESSTPSSALQGQLTTSLTSFSRILDSYSAAAGQELVPEKAAKASDRLSNFRAELLDYKSRFAALKAAKDEAQLESNRAELFNNSSSSGGGGGASAGARKGYTAGRDTPENPYNDAAVAAGAQATNPLFRGAGASAGAGGGPNAYSSYRSPYALSTNEGDGQREAHALREQGFFGSTNATLDEYIERGRAVLGDLGDQRDMLKGTQRKLYSVANTLGVSGDTIRMVERRAKQDKWIFWAGVVIFVVFVYFVLRWLR
ncbi:hypothetical protein MBLNU459_g5085t1 [Dothideomycetes sp. NU459]